MRCLIFFQCVEFASRCDLIVIALPIHNPSQSPRQHQSKGLCANRIAARISFNTTQIFFDVPMRLHISCHDNALLYISKSNQFAFLGFACHTNRIAFALDLCVIHSLPNISKSSLDVSIQQSIQIHSIHQFDCVHIASGSSNH